MASTIFAGISFVTEEQLLCKKMTQAAERWPFVKVQSGLCSKSWFGETLPGISERKWRTCNSREVRYGRLPDRSEPFKLNSLDPGVVVRPHVGEVELWSGGGLTPIFYAFDNGNLIVGSDPTIVCAALRSLPCLDPIGIASLFSLEYQTPTRTLFQQVQRLAPYHWIKGGEAGWGQATSYVKPFMASFPGAESASVDHAAECLERAMSEAVGDGNGVCLPLTGGVDSRTLLAAARSCGKLRSYTRGLASDAEVVTAAKLAGIKKIPHRYYPFPDNYLERSFPRIVHLTGGCVPAQHGHAIHPLDQLVKVGVHSVLPGTNGEFGRGYWPAHHFTGLTNGAEFWECLFDLKLSFNETTIRDAFQVPWSDALLASIDDVRREFAVDIPVGSGFPQIDLDWIYFLRRVPHFIAWGPYIWNSVFQVALPFTDLQYVKAVAGLPAPLRLGPTVHKSIMQSRNPEFLALPLVPSGQRLEPRMWEEWRAVWRKRIRSKLGVSPASPQKYTSWLQREARFVESVLFSDAAKDRGIFRISGIQKLWQDHLRGRGRTSVLCKLLTLELACRINLEEMPVTWDS